MISPRRRLKSTLSSDPRVRMEYSDAYFGLSNYADYAKWECIRSRIRQEEFLLLLPVCLQQYGEIQIL